jgi:phage/plasmid primase-like uncharacterized protein
VDLLMERRAEAPDPRYKVAISCPTNADARAVGAEVRKRRQATGEVGPDVVTIKANDQTGSEYDLPIAVGDRLRLFTRVRAGGAVGDNGSVVEVLEVNPAHGLTVRNQNGREAVVPWRSFRHRETGQIMLTYGDALTIDARQGDTSSEHITVMPAGSSAVNGYKAYTTESRHRVRSWLVTSEGEEMQEIISRRPLGDPRNLEADPATTRASVLSNMARNLNRHPEKQLATDFLDMARAIKHGAIDAMQAAWHRVEVRKERRKKSPAPQQQQEKAAAMERVNQAAERAAPPPAPRREQPKMSESEIQVAFAAELDRLGLRLPGPPIMDGEKHTVQVEGAKGKRKSGWYRGFADGNRHSVAGNSKSGEMIRWRPDRTETKPLSPDEVAAQRAAAAADRKAREAAQIRKDEAAAAEADRIWKAAKPARPDHPYLVAKGIREPGILRQAQKGETAQMTEKTINIGGRLIVPMRDVDGKLWNVQMISRTGSKVFLPGRKKGLFAVIGKDQNPTNPLIFTEGFATGHTLNNTTALRTVIAIDSGNMLAVAQAVHAKYPDRPKIFAADNDHHLPGVSYNLEASQDGRVAVSWAKGATGKAEGGNTVEYRVAGAADTDWKAAVTGTQETSVTIEKLLAGARYEVRVFSSSNRGPLPNVGVVKAREAAASVGGTVAIPHFPADDPGTDWKDYEQKHGATRTALELAKQGVPIVSRPAPAPAAQTAAQRRQHSAMYSVDQKPEHRP